MAHYAVSQDSHSTVVIATIMAILSLLSSLFMVVRWVSNLCAKRRDEAHNSEFSTFIAMSSLVSSLGFIVYRPAVAAVVDTHPMCEWQTVLLQFGWLAIVAWLAAGWHSTYLRTKHQFTYNPDGDVVVAVASEPAGSSPRRLEMSPSDRDLADLGATSGPAVVSEPASKASSHAVTEGTRPRSSTAAKRQRLLRAGDAGVSFRTQRRLIKAESTYWRYHIVCWGIALLSAFLSGLTGHSGTSDGAWCWISSEAVLARAVNFYGPGFILLAISIYYFLRWRRLVKRTGSAVTDDGLALSIVLYVTVGTVVLFVIEKAVSALFNGDNQHAHSLNNIVDIVVPCQGILFNGPVIIAVTVEHARRKAATQLALLAKPNVEEMSWYERTVKEVLEKTAQLRDFEKTWRLRPYTSKDQKATSSAVRKQFVIIVLFACITTYRGSLGTFEHAANQYYSVFAFNALRSFVAAFWFIVWILIVKLCLAKGWMKPSLRSYFETQGRFTVEKGNLRFTLLMIGMTIFNNQLPVNLMAIVSDIIPSTIVPVFLSTVPILTLFMKLVFFRSTSNLSLPVAIGLTVSLAGAVFISYPQFAVSASKAQGGTLGIILGMVIPLSWAFAALYNKMWLKDFAKFQWTKAFYVNWVGGIVSLVAAGVAGGADLQAWHSDWSEVGWVIFLGSLAAIGSIWTYTLLDLVDPVAFGTIWTMVPIVGVVIELISTGGHIPSGGAQFAGVVLVVAGIVILLQQK